MFERKQINGLKRCKTNHSTMDVLNVIACNIVIACILVQPLHAIDTEAKNGDNESAIRAQSAINNNKNDELSIVKRAAGQRAYNFGLGKRESEAAFDENEADEDMDTAYDKRQSQRFSFGLGKRVADYRANGDSRFSFGLGKRDLSDEEEDSIAKRAQMQRYQFGLGKKSAPSRYAFGLGKRHYVPRQFDDLFKRRYSFGLGK